MLLFYHFLSLVCFVQYVVGSLSVEFSLPTVIRNEEPVPVYLSVVGETLESGQISGVRTVLYTPGKRGPKFYANYTHKSYKVTPESVELTPVYVLPTKDFKIGFSVLVAYNNEKVWIDSHFQDIKVTDPAIRFVRFIISLVVIAFTLFGIAFLASRLAPVGYWNQVLPARLHKYLPEKPKKN